MRILYFHQYFTTLEGKGGTRSYELARYLINKGHRVTIVCGCSRNTDSGLIEQYVHNRREGMVDGIRVIQFYLPYSNCYGKLKRAWVFMRFVLKSIKLIFSEKYDLLFSTSTPLTIAIPGIIGKIFRKKPFVFEVRDLWPEGLVAIGVLKSKLVIQLLDWLETLAYRYANSCIALSPGIVDGIRRKIPDKRIIMIPNGCDLKEFSSKRKSLTLLYRNKFNQDDFVAVFAGAHGVANGLDAILDVAFILKKRDENKIKFLFIGDGAEKSHLKNRVLDEGLNNCIFFDFIQKTDLFNLFSMVDAGLMVLKNVPAFYYATSPNKFFDYIACGLPVIINYPGWLANLLKEYDCGFAVQPGNPVAFADALAILASNKQLCQQKGESSKKLAETLFSRDKLAEKFCHFLEEEICI